MQQCSQCYSVTPLNKGISLQTENKVDTRQGLSPTRKHLQQDFHHNLPQIRTFFSLAISNFLHAEFASVNQICSVRKEAEGNKQSKP